MGARARQTPPPIQKPVVAIGLITPSQPPHLKIAQPRDIGRLQARDPFRHRPQYHFLYLHRPLHGGPRIRLHTYVHGDILVAPMRTFHLLGPPDISCANDRRRPVWLHKGNNAILMS